MPASAQKTRVALLQDVQVICKETCHMLGLEISKSAMDIVTELIYKKLPVYGTDLEAFAKHAKRTTINTEDVKLLVRRCPSLKSHLESLAPATATSKEKKRKTIAAFGQLETPSSKTKDQDLSSKLKKTAVTGQSESLITKLKNQELSSKQNKPESSILKEKLSENAASTNELEAEKLDSMITEELIDLTFD